ncbi:hypothetical protein J0H58_38705 [bacterium]|nr:hypothetical protein [bacterium]
MSWGRVSALAWAGLNRDGPPPPAVSGGRLHHGQPRLRLWSDPHGVGGEVEPTTLTVFELRTEARQREPVVRQSVWQRSADLDRVYQAVEQTEGVVSAEPAVAERWASVPREQLSALLREAVELRVRVAWPDRRDSVSSGASGTGFEFFSRNQPPASLRLEWWDDTPPEWQPVIDWHGRVWRLLAGCLPGGQGHTEPRAAADRGLDSDS